MRALAAWGIPTFMILTSLAGCVDDPTPGATDSAGRLVGGVPVDEEGNLLIDPDWAENALAGSGSGHDHTDVKSHQGRTTPNFEVVGYNPLITDWHGKTTGDYFCGGYAERDGRAYAVVHSFGSDVAFVLSDVSDPANPKKIGELVMDNTQVYDATITPDLQYVLLATSPMDSGPDADPDSLPTSLPAAGYGEARWRDACTGEETPVPLALDDGPEAGLPFASGIVLVSIENPRNPIVVDFRMFPVMGGHSVRAHEVDGETLLLVSVPNLGGHADSYYVFMEIQDAPNGGLMVPLSVYQWMPDDPMTMTGGTGMHDGFIHRHPITGELLAYLAYGGQGLVVLNIDDPANPQFLAHWADWGVLGEAASTSSYIHEAVPVDGVWDGKHYTFIGDECVGRTAIAPTCYIYVLDTTDPTNIQFVGAWTLPVDVQWDAGLQYSLHYIGLVGRTLMVTTYHGGVWAIDVSTEENLRLMPAVGVFIPANESPKPVTDVPRSLIVQQLYGGYALDYTPVVLDFEVAGDGTMFVFDGQTGLYAVTFDPTVRAPPPRPWPLGYNVDLIAEKFGDEA